jgi:hypothetical protein
MRIMQPFVAGIVVAGLMTACSSKESPPSATQGPAKAEAAAPAPARAAPAAAEGHAPYVIGAGGQRMLEGYVTTFTGPSGAVTIPYTQLSGAWNQGAMLVSLSATSGDGPSPTPQLSAILDGGPDIKTHADLAGKSFTDFDAMKGRPFTVALASGSGLLARSAEVKIVNVAADAIEGTFTAELYDSPMDDAKLVAKITDGKFRAYPAQLVTEEMLKAVQKK